jgi:hypothetical protein
VSTNDALCDGFCQRSGTVALRPVMRGQENVLTSATADRSWETVRRGRVWLVVALAGVISGSLSVASDAVASTAMTWSALEAVPQGPAVRVWVATDWSLVCDGELLCCR